MRHVHDSTHTLNSTLLRTGTWLAVGLFLAGTALASTRNRPRGTESGDSEASKVPAHLMLDILIETESASGESAQIPIEMQVAASGQPGEIRIGNEVPIPVTSFVSPNGTAGGIPQTPVTSFQYRNVGLNINLSAVPVENAFRLTLQIEQSSEKQGRTIGGVELPVFGTTTYNHETTLRDGESRELATVKDSDGGTIRHIRLALRVLP